MAAAILVPAVGLMGAPLSLILGALIYAVLIWLRLELTHKVSVAAKVLMQSGWLMVVVSAAGWLFAGGDEQHLAGILARLAFATSCLGLTYVFFLRGQTSNWPGLRLLLRRSGS